MTCTSSANAVSRFVKVAIRRRRKAGADAPGSKARWYRLSAVDARVGARVRKAGQSAVDDQLIRHGGGVPKDSRLKVTEAVDLDPVGRPGGVLMISMAPAAFRRHNRRRP